MLQNHDNPHTGSTAQWQEQNDSICVPVRLSINVTYSFCDKNIQYVFNDKETNRKVQNVLWDILQNNSPFLNISK